MFLSNFFGIGKQANLDAEEIVKSEAQYQYQRVEAIEEGTKYTDEDLLITTSHWKQYSQISKENRDKRGKYNIEYYIGNVKWQTSDKHSIQDNRIFMSMETVVPLITAKPALPIVYGAEKLEEQKWQKILLAMARDMDLRKKLSVVYRHNQCYGLGCMKVSLCEGEIETDYVLIDRLIIDPAATCVEEAEFIGQIFYMTAGDVVEKYPKYKTEITEDVGAKMGTRIQIIEWWTDDYKCVTYEGKNRYILEKGPNPHFDKENPKNNYLKESRLPYFFFNVFEMGYTFEDLTTTLEQARTLQDAINRRKRQIDINAETTGNPIKLGKGLNQAQLDEFANKVTAGTVMTVGQNQEMAYLQPAGLPPYIMEDLYHNIKEIDNLFGTQGSIRGERDGEETAQGRQLLRQGSQDRQSTAGSALEYMMQEIYRFWLQLIKVHFNDGKKSVTYIGEKGETEKFDFTGKDVSRDMKIEVLAGSIIPDDKVYLATQAIELWKMNGISIDELYAKLGWEDSKSKAEQFKIWEADKQVKSQKMLAEQAQIEQEAAAKQQQFDQIKGQIMQLGNPEGNPGMQMPGQAIPQG